VSLDAAENKRKENEKGRTDLARRLRDLAVLLDQVFLVGDPLGFLPSDLMVFS
jgi:hypothetical protein